MTSRKPTPEFAPLGPDGILIRFARVLSQTANAQALALSEQIKQHAPPGICDVAASLTSVHVTFDPAKTTRPQLTRALQNLLQSTDTTATAPKRLWHIPTAFGPNHAPQLAEVASFAGLTPHQAVAQITSQTLRVIAIGFAPGQPYLGMMPPAWDIPRQTTLTPKMPNGALVTAVRQLIIFAADAPTGWRHIGQTAFRVYQPTRAVPFAFQPGDAVQFTAVSDDTLRDLQTNTDSNGGARCEVLF